VDVNTKVGIWTWSELETPSTTLDSGETGRLEYGVVAPSDELDGAGRMVVIAKYDVDAQSRLPDGTDLGIERDCTVFHVCAVAELIPKAVEAAPPTVMPED